LLRKETVLPEPAGPVFRLAPYVSFAGYATVPLLIPFGLPLGYMGDILDGGLILGMAGFAVSLAAIDNGSPTPNWAPAACGRSGHSRSQPSSS
jgi:formate hydrogenlyase subunit 4